MAALSTRRPNILVCGTPGTGKTTLSDAVAERLGFSVFHVGDEIKTRGLCGSRDEEFDAYVLDEASEDKLLDEMEPLMGMGGVVVDFHSVDFFPERWFDLVLVLRTDNTLLYDRLKARGYSDRKLEENVSAEIMCVVAEEARESYAESIVHEVPSNTVEDVASNIERVAAWYDQWQRDHAGDGAVGGEA